MKNSFPSFKDFAVRKGCGSGESVGTGGTGENKSGKVHRRGSFCFWYVFPVVLVLCGAIFSAKIFAEQSGLTPESGVSSRIKIVYESLVGLGHGSDSASTWGDWGDWNRIRSAGEWLPGGSATVDDVLPGKTFYSGDSRVEKTGSAVVGKYAQQANIAYDDWLANDSTANEYIGEEQVWTLTAQGGSNASVTDNGVTQSIASNRVYQDSLTKLYWSDRASSALDNEFVWTLGDDRVNPTGASCNFNSAGNANQYCDNQDPLNAYSEDNDVSAAEFCLNLQLDGDNADGDDNGLTGVETDWRLPTQKELMQAYIDGSANNLPNAGTNFWSSTETSSSKSYAWYVGLSYGGYANYYGKSYNNTVRCVRGGL